MMKSPFRLWLRTASSLMLAAVLLLVMTLSLTLAQNAGLLARVTTSPQSDRMSQYASLSADGTRVAFVSDADFFGQGIQKHQFEIWLYDTTTLTLTRITTASASNRYSFSPTLNADGMKVAFESNADLLGQGISDYQYEIWLYDTNAMTYTRITTASESGRSSTYPRFSANGSKVVFQSDSDLLNQGIPNEQYEVWLYDSGTMTYTRITTASHSDRDSGVGRGVYALDISADGARIAFGSDSDFLNEGIQDGQIEVWLYDTTTLTYTRLTSATNSYPSIGRVSISGDGAKVAFVSDADYLGQGIEPGQLEVWLFDTAAMTLTRITTASAPNLLAFSRDPSLNADGTKITFVSDSDFLGQGNIAPGQGEIWLYNTMTMTYTRLTTASSNDRYSYLSSPNADVSRIAFSSNSDFLNQSIPESVIEIWLLDLAIPATYLPVIFKNGL